MEQPQKKLLTLVKVSEGEFRRLARLIGRVICTVEV